MVKKSSPGSLGIALSLVLAAFTTQPNAESNQKSIPDAQIQHDAVTTETLFQVKRIKTNSVSVLTLNLNRLFDDIDNGNKEIVLTPKRFQKRLHITATAFAEQFHLPDILALQEVENLNVLEQIASIIQQRHHVSYQAVLVEGQDVSGIDVGYLLRDDLIIQHTEALFARERSNHYGAALFSRPPLYIEVCRRQNCFALLNLHLRSMRGINSRTKGDRVARKRRQQAETIAAWTNQWQQLSRVRSLLILGDFNALTPSDKHVDIAGTLLGDPDSDSTRLPARDLLDPDLIDLTRHIPKDRRYSFIYRGQRQQLDYMFVNQSFEFGLESIEYARIDRSLSDHAALYASFRLLD